MAYSINKEIAVSNTFLYLTAQIFYFPSRSFYVNVAEVT